MKYADPVAQRRIEQLEAEVAEQDAQFERLDALYVRERKHQGEEYLKVCAERDELRAKVARVEERLGDPIPQVDPVSLLRRIGTRHDSPLDAPLTPSEPSSLPTAPGTPNDATGGAE